MKELLYIKANGIIYKPQKAGVQEPGKIKGYCYPVCEIKKKAFGRWEIKYFDEYIYYKYSHGYYHVDNQIPNATVILYPSGIEEIKYINKTK